MTRDTDSDPTTTRRFGRRTVLAGTGATLGIGGLLPRTTRAQTREISVDILGTNSPVPAGDVLWVLVRLTNRTLENYELTVRLVVGYSPDVVHTRPIRLSGGRRRTIWLGYYTYRVERSQTFPAVVIADSGHRYGDVDWTWVRAIAGVRQAQEGDEEQIEADIEAEMARIRESDLPEAGTLPEEPPDEIPDADTADRSDTDDVSDEGDGADETAGDDGDLPEEPPEVPPDDL